MVGLLDVIAGALIPLVWSTSVEFGGLGMSPASIGLWMAGYGSHQWHLSIRCLPSHRQALRLAARLYRQHPLIFPSVHYVPL
jgi:hypothetical protein